MKYQTVNPATAEVIATYDMMSKQTALHIARRSAAAFATWRGLSVRERAPFFVELAAVLRRNRDRYAELVTCEMGKTITESKGEVEKCAWLCEVYAEKAEAWLADEQVAADGRRHTVAFEPLGVILSIMPWNYPFWQALRFAVPTLIAGNTSVLKHARNVTGCALVIEEAFGEARFPADVFLTVLADHATVTELIASNFTAGVSLTGSTEAGARIGEAAGKNLKKVVLELGGSDPFIVLEDADIEFTARNAVKGRMVASGQSCIAAKRFIVLKSVAEPFTRRFAELMGQLVVGDPMDEQTEVGAIVNREGLEELQRQLRESLALGAEIVTGGQRVAGKGYFFEPTVVANVTREMPLVAEEVFGPIAPVIVVKDEAEAVQVANDSAFGLGGSVWTRDLDRGVQIARRVESGTLFVNSFVKSDPRMPFGGVKRSGIGRELSKYGLREFVNVKGINVYDHR
jgi:succinate-semialdehyde dehydrogenase/glutarate-semialdehyde dehydrogenase